MVKPGFDQSLMRGRLSRNVPMPSAFFTGREVERTRLHTALQTQAAAGAPVPVVLHGPAGVGKTQVACRYAHQHRADYAGVFWVQGNALEGVSAQLAGFAPELVPHVLTVPDPQAMVQAVRDWFAAHTGWLLVVDNADSLPDLDALSLLPTTGRVLLIARDRMLAPAAETVEVGRLDEAAGALLLLYTARTLAYTLPLKAAEALWQEGAKAISRETAGLPLALAQAGAYLSQQSVTPQKYLALYRAYAARLPCACEDPDRRAVAVTTALALEQVKRLPGIGRYAESLAQFAAFAGSDLLPNELMLRGKYVTQALESSADIGALDVSDVRAALCDYGLARRVPDLAALWMHDLTRDVLRESMTPEVTGEMMTRFVLAVEAAFPWPEADTWPLCERLWPHALRCEHYIVSGEVLMLPAVSLLKKMAVYMQQRLQYEDALRLRQAELRVLRLLHGDEHDDVVAVLNKAAALCRVIEREEAAAHYLEESNAIRLRLRNKNAPAIISGLHAQAQVCYRQGRLDAMTALYQEALDIASRNLGPTHPTTATCLGALATAYIRTERYMEAEGLLMTALSIGRRTIGKNHPDYATRLINLAALYVKWNRPYEAEALLAQAQTIRERTHGPEHAAVAHCHYWRGRMYYAQGNLPAAVTAFQRTLDIRKGTLRVQHPDTIAARTWLEKVQRELAGL